MTATSFEEFKKDSQASYASNLARAEDIPLEDALANASEQFQKLVPDGNQTSGQSFFDVIDDQSNQPIGFLWLGFQTRFGRKIASINDISIDETYRGKGFGKALMKLVEEESRKSGVTRVRLHVFHHNEVAKNLYLAMGFTPSSLDMRKDL